MVHHDLLYSTEMIFTGVFTGVLMFQRFFKAKIPSRIASLVVYLMLAANPSQNYYSCKVLATALGSLQGTVHTLINGMHVRHKITVSQ